MEYRNALANHEWKCSPNGAVACINTQTGFQVGNPWSAAAVNACGASVPACYFRGLDKLVSAGGAPSQAGIKARSSYRPLNPAFLGGMANDGEVRFRNFNAAIPVVTTGIGVTETVSEPAAEVKTGKKKTVLPYAAGLGGALLGYFIFDRFVPFKFSKYAGLVIGAYGGFLITKKMGM